MPDRAIQSIFDASWTGKKASSSGSGRKVRSWHRGSLAEPRSGGMRRGLASS